MADVLYNKRIRPVIVKKAPIILPAFAAEKGIEFHAGVVCAMQPCW